MQILQYVTCYFIIPKVMAYGRSKKTISHVGKDCFHSKYRCSRLNAFVFALLEIVRVVISIYSASSCPTSSYNSSKYLHLVSMVLFDEFVRNVFLFFFNYFLINLINILAFFFKVFELYIFFVNFR